MHRNEQHHHASLREH